MRPKEHRSVARTKLIVCSIAVATAAAWFVGAAAPEPSRAVAIVVQARGTSPTAAERLVRRLGGHVRRALPLVHGFVASIPKAQLRALGGASSVAEVWRDAPIHMSDTGDLAALDALPPTPWAAAIGLPRVRDTYDGSGVSVAMVDTGVASVPDLNARVAERVDFTSERDGIDRFGHGTHMAGVIAGDGTASAGARTGTAPGVALVSVKVAGADGSTDVSTVLAGLQWVASNEQRLHIRVLNLSFGTDSTQSSAVDPLNYAVEQLWASGLLVVVAAGNSGPLPGSVEKPGDDPFVLTVGAADPAGLSAPFSSQGPTVDGFAKPDLLAPGVSIVSTRAPGSTIDLARPDARVGTDYFKGSGTSQATAITAGVAALLFEANPALTPDEAKAVLIDTTRPSGLLDAAAAVDGALHPPLATGPAVAPSTGLGLLEASRGSFHVQSDPGGTGVMTPVVGEVDVRGVPWDATAWSSMFWTSGSWNPVSWQAVLWTFWDAKTWSAKTWSAKTWSATDWN
jgi:serine protease AprX